MDDKLKNKIAELKETLAEERELRKSLQRELNDTRKLLGKARALADKMSGACAALVEAVEEEGTGKKPVRKDDSDKKPRGDKKPSKNGDKKPSKNGSKGDGKKPGKDGGKKDGGKKPSKVVKLTEDDDDEAPRPKKVKDGKKPSKNGEKNGDKKPSKDGKKGGDKKPSKDGKKGDSKKDALKVKGKAPKKVNKHEVDLDDDYED